jgi:hypothetical protein
VSPETRYPVPPILILGNSLIANTQTAKSLEQRSGGQLMIGCVGFMGVVVALQIHLQRGKVGVLHKAARVLKMRMLNSSAENPSSGKPRTQIKRFHIRGGEMNTAFKFLILWLFIAYAHAGTCNYPIIDGAPKGYKTSHSNLDGKLVAIEGGVLKIKENKTGRLVQVSLPKEKFPIYSAFGGDGDSSDLKLGVYTWVWYKDCKKINTESPAEIGYLKIYSANPKDQPNAKSIRLGREN